jgi:hypothetical protein
MVIDLPYRGGTKTFELGELLGQGADATVYRLKNPGVPGCENGCVIKFYIKSPNAADAVNAIERGSEEYLPDAGVLQLKNRAYEAVGYPPYIIQDELKLGDDVKMFNKDLNAFGADPGLGQAVVDMFYALASKGYAWEDAHLGNIFFKEVEGKWVAGILDQDRIIKYSLARESDRLGGVFARAELAWMPGIEGMRLKGVGNVKSMLKTRDALQNSWARQNFGKDFMALQYDQRQDFFDGVQKYCADNPGPHFPDAEFFMEKAFEYKGYLRYDPATGKFVKGLIDPEIVKSRFPKLENPDRIAPLDGLTKGMWKTGMADPPVNVVPFVPKARLTGVDAGFALAA